MAELSSTALFNDASLVSYYKLENVNDSKASNNLTNNNSVTFNAAKYNNGGDLGASNTNKSLSTVATFGINDGAWSFVFWVKMDTEVSGGASWRFLEHIRFSTFHIRTQLLYTEASGAHNLSLHRVRMGIADDATSNYNFALGTSTFHHIAGTYDGTNMTLYVDGVSQATGTSTGDGNANQLSEGLNIGAGIDATAPTSAIFDDFAVFTRALTQPEILTLYQDTGHFMGMGKYW